jgi:processive 1,2-diacylglycerol beta-glucosyltransferase
MKIDAEVIVVCGKNKEVKDSAEYIKRRYDSKNIHVLGFINNVYELLKISDIVISKPGGATVTECIETKNVMLILPGIGGQEKFNANFMCKNNHGLKVRFAFTFRRVLSKLLNNEKELKRLKNSYSKESKNESLEKISKLIGEELI